MTKRYYIEIGSITGKRLFFWIDFSTHSSWKQLLTAEELNYWGFEKLHDKPPTHCPEWNCKKSLMQLL